MFYSYVNPPSGKNIARRVTERSGILGAVARRYDYYIPVCISSPGRPQARLVVPTINVFVVAQLKNAEAEDDRREEKIKRFVLCSSFLTVCVEQL